MREWASRLAGWGAPPVLRALVRSWRFQEVDPADGSQGPPRRRATGELYALWHQQLLMLTLRHRDENIAVMISRSRDGDAASRMVERLGYRIIRGSSSRGGAEGLRQMIEAAGEGRSLALTIDGPRGPARKCKAGAVLMAARSDVPIVPTVAIPDRATAVNSWDRFLIPAPGSRVFVSYGRPIRVSTDGSAEDIAGWQRRVEDEMERLVDMCESAAGTAWPRSRNR